MVKRHGYVYAGVRMEMKPGVLYTFNELTNLLLDITNEPLEAVEAMIEDGLIGVHARRYYLTHEGIAYH